jgi:pyruvate dehydrogenase E2 component (dihydrolipoamide acetyltransferase)
LTPVLRDAAERPVDELAEDWRILKDKINRQRLVQEDYEGASFYLSNLGLFPVVHSFDALVPLGAAAILAIGAECCGQCLFTLSCDHRVVSGADSARFLTTLQGYLQHPDKLLVQF